MRANLACLALACSLAACGGSEPEPDGAVSPATTSPETTAPAEAEEPASAADEFMTPSTNIVCAFLADGPALRCDIRSGLDPPPVGECELDWTGLVLGATGPGEPQCAGDAVPFEDASVLGYGQRWARDGIECASSESGLECANEDGGSFFLSRESWEAG